MQALVDSLAAQCGDLRREVAQLQAQVENQRAELQYYTTRLPELQEDLLDARSYIKNCSDMIEDTPEKGNLLAVKIKRLQEALAAAQQDKERLDRLNSQHVCLTPLGVPGKPPEAWCATSMESGDAWFRRSLREAIDAGTQGWAQ